MINTDLSIQKRWVARRSFNNSFTLTITNGGAAYDVTSYTFVANIRKIGASTNSLQLTQGSGITNGGATGVVTIQLSAANSETLTVGSYYYEVNYTVSTLSYGLLHGTFDLLNQYNPENENNAVSIAVNLAGTDVNLAISLVGGGSSIQFQDEGSNLGNNQADTVDFVGAGVTATRLDDKVTVTIPGGSFSGLTATRVIVATGSSSVGDYSTFTFDSTNNALTVNGIRLVKGSGTVANSSVFLGSGAGNFTTFTTSRGRNIGIGTSALSSLIDGAAVYESSHNVAIGYQSMMSATTAQQCVTIGDSTGKSLTTGTNNVYIGAYVGQFGTTSYSNTGVGYNVFGSASFAANENTAIGFTAGQSLTTGTRNVFLGPCGQAVTTGNYNVFAGSETFERITTQTGNVGYGHNAGVYNRGQQNTAVGHFSLGQLTTDSVGNTASYNTTIGGQAGRYLVTGDYNTWIGYDTGTAGVGESYSNTVAIGKATKVTESNSFVLGGVIDANANNYGFGGESYASGSRVIFVKNAVANPSGNPTNGFILYSDGGVAKVLNASGTAMTLFGNPMTTEGDLILGGASGVAGRLAIGANNYVLTSNGTTASWQASAAGFADPMTTRGDIIIRNAANATARLGIGANTYVLTSDGTDISWAAPTASSGWLTTGTTTLTGAVTVVGTSTNTQTHQFNALGASVTDCWLLTNDTDAAAGAQQYSPFIRQRARGWKTNATAASQTVDFDFGVTSTQAAAAPTGNWLLRASVNGAAYTNAISVSSDIVNSGIVFTNGGWTMTGTTNGTLAGNGTTTLRGGGSSTLQLQTNCTSVIPASGYGISLGNLNANVTATSGTYSHIGITSGFAPTSGTAVYNSVILVQTFNQTGGANGIVTLFKITPTYTATGGDTFFIDYSPTVTSIAGVHYCWRSTAGLMALSGSTTGSATFRIAHGSAPSSPVDGDIWTTTAGLYVRINGSTVGPLS